MAVEMTRRALARSIAGALLASQSKLPAAGLEGMLWDYTQEYMRILEDRRQEAFDAMSSPADIAALRTRVRDELQRMWGPFPTERSPLNVQEKGVIERDEFVIEKLIFESRPGFYVTANLYRPKQVDRRLPAVIVPCGHTDEGKAAEAYQRFCILLAQNGFIALIYDPVGQGERVQLWDSEKDQPLIGAGTAEHRALGHASLLVGMNLMNYRVWDTSRAIDYLQTRSDVDPNRIAMGGNSGGGMETLQYAAFDDRIAAAFPSCAVASFPAKTRALLIADAEQILYGTLRAGIDHPELLAAFAPKPLAIGSAIQDYVPIEAARRTYREVQRAYRIMDAEDHVRQIETDAGHGLNEELREGAVDWFSRWLSEVSHAVDERETPISTPKELQCTPTGQAVTSYGGRTVPDMHRERYEAIRPRFALPNPGDFQNFRVAIQQAVQRVTRVGAYRPEQGIYVTDRMLMPTSHPRGLLLVVSDAGRDDPEVRRRVIDPILTAGYEVLALDLRGWGDSKPISRVKVNFDWERFFAYRALEIGKPLLGQRMKDLLAINPTRTHLQSWGVAGVGPNAALVAAHVAALDARVDRLLTVGGPLSFEALLDPLSKQPASNYLPGVLSEYEIRDLYASVAPRKTLVVNPEDGRRRQVNQVRAWEQYDWARQAYELFARPDRFQLRTELDTTGVRDAIIEWLNA